MSLVGRWLLQESGVGNTYSGTVGPTGTLTSGTTAAWSVPGPGGSLPRGVGFSGITGHYIDIPPMSYLRNTTGFSVTAWARMPSGVPVRAHTLIALNETGAGKRLQVSLGNSNATGVQVNVNFNDNGSLRSYTTNPYSKAYWETWRLWTTTVNWSTTGSVTTRRYLDGSLIDFDVQATTGTGTLNTNPLDFVLGSYTGNINGGAPAVGSWIQLADVRLYDDVISDSTISGIYTSGGSDNPPGPTGGSGGGSSGDTGIYVPYTGLYQKLGNHSLFVNHYAIVVDKTNPSGMGHFNGTKRIPQQTSGFYSHRFRYP